MKLTGNKRIATNTIALYLKMVYSILVALFTTRIVLSALGVDDYGIYTLVAGVISLLTFLNVSMAIATQRFMSIAMGQKNLDKLKDVFQTSVTLHLWIGVIVVVSLEIFGLFLFDGLLNIAEDRIYSAKIIYQFMIFSTFFTINAVPYDAAINANEDMWVDSIIGFIETTLKLFIAFYLLNTSFDKLIVYSLLTTVVLILSRIVKSVYCKRKYEECKHAIHSLKSGNKIVMKEMAGFAGWNTFGALVFVGRNQLIAIVLNVFYGTVINAAFGVANQVNAQISSFAMTLLKAINPQITKSEGEGNRIRMLQMADYSTKFSFFIFSLLLVPLFLEMDFILGLWLKVVPEHTVIFCQLILIASLIKQLSNGVMLSVQSVGKLKVYTLVINAIYLLNILFAVLLLHFGFEPYFVIISMIVIEFIALLARSIIASKIISDFNFKIFFINIICKQLIVFSLVLLLAYLPSLKLSESFFRLISTGLISTSSLFILFYFTILNKIERNKIENLLKSKILRKK